MKHGRLLPLIILIAVAFCTANAFAQGGGPPPPPPCCKGEDPPPGENSLTTTATTTDAITVISISDATLQASGLTRSQFLDLLAAILLDPSAGPVSLAIPVVGQVTLADGSVSYQVTYFTIEKSKVAEEVLNSLNAVYLTDGKTVIGINFIPDSIAQ